VGVKRRRVPTPVLLTLVAALVAGVAVMLTTAQPAQSTLTDKCSRFANESADRARDPMGSGRSVVVIGDSYSVGLGLEDPRSAWPDSLPGRVHVFGFSGSGFSEYASRCGPVAYYERAVEAMRDKPSLVVVEGGLIDVGQSTAAIRYGYRHLLAVIGHRRLLVVGPAPAPLRLRGAIRVDRLLRKLTKASGTPYVSMINGHYTYLDDDLHLTETGHREFGARVAAVLARSQQRGTAKRA
jgi:acyl-CoA thioesterase-1